MELRGYLRKLVEPTHAAVLASEALDSVGGLIPSGIKNLINFKCGALGLAHPASVAFLACAIGSIWLYRRTQDEREEDANNERLAEIVGEFSSVRASLEKHLDLGQVPKTWRNNPEFVLMAIAEHSSLKLDVLEAKGETVLIRIASLVERCEGIEDELRRGFADSIGLVGRLSDRVESIQKAFGPPLKAILPVRNPLATDSDRLVYERRAATYVGREEELASLTKWLRSNADFDWELWHGPAGSGKSRLALELVIRALSLGWDASFFNGEIQYDAWRAWKPDRPTLVVFDYAREMPKRIGAAIESLSGRPKDVKVRFLLLERTYDERETWVGELKAACGGAGWQRMTTPKALGDIGKGAFADIGLEICSNRLKVIRKAPIPRHQFDFFFNISLEKITAEVPEERRLGLRPLFAHFLGEAIADEGFDAIRKWDLRTLSGWWLKRELRHWAIADVTEEEINLLVLATVLGGIEDEERLAFAKEHPTAHIPLVSGVTHWGYLKPLAGLRSDFGPLQPDILGEALVLERLENGSMMQLNTSVMPGPAKATEALLRAAWRRAEEVHSFQAATFYIRCIQDFPRHPALARLFESAKPGTFLADALRSDAISHLIISGNYDLAETIFSEIRSSGMRAGALFNKGFAFDQLERPEDAITAYDALLEMPDAPSDQKAMALLNKGVTLGHLDRPEDEIATYDALLDMAEAPSDQKAKALFNKGVKLGQLEQLDDEIKAYDVLLDMSDAPSDQKAKALLSKGVTLGQLERPEDEIAAYDALLDMFDASSDQKATALFNKGVKLGQLERPKEAIAAYDVLLGMADAPPDPKAAALLSKGLTLADLGRTREAIDCCDAVLTMSNVPVELYQTALQLIKLFLGLDD